MNTNYCLRRAARYSGDQIAIRHEDGDLTYRQFASDVEQTARRLMAWGVRKGDRVAVLMQNSPGYLDLYFSIPMTGAMIVPLNTRWNAAEVAFTLQDSGAKCLIVDERFAAMPSEVPVVHIRELHALSPDQEARFEEPHENDLVGLFYTSGTTGGPKGAMLSHRNLYANAVSAILPPALFVPGSVYLHAAPMFHLADVGTILAAVLSGSTHAFLETFDPGRLLELIELHRVSITLLVPTMLNIVLNHPKFDQYDLSSLKRVCYGATPMPLPLLRLAIEKLGCEFAQGYGMTEASPIITVLGPEDHELDKGSEAVRSAGKPVLGVEVRVVDDQDRDMPNGECGEIIFRGPNTMRGYWNRPEITAEALRGGWMHTGDMGRCDEQGYLYILDRKKDMIKPGGENVYSPEVESVICAHPAVLEAAVFGIPHPMWGEAIRAAIATRPGTSLTEDELIEWCRERLTHFKCPTSVVFADALPKGGTGKVQKNLLRQQYAS